MPARSRPAFKAGRRAWLWPAAALLAALLPAAAPAADRIVLVYDRDSAAHQEAMRAALEELRQQGHEVAVEHRGVDEPGSDRPEAQAQDAPRLTITVGLAAARSVRERAPGAPVLHTLVSSHVARGLVADDGPARVLHLDQPVARFAGLLGAAFPSNSRVAILLGPSSGTESDALRRALGERFALRMEVVTEHGELIPALERLLRQSDVLLAIPDPVLYNRFTVQKILLTTYRHAVPVVAFSASLVRAGAALALHSTPRQLGRQIGETIHALLRAGTSRVPPLQGPRYFTVTVNEQVARSLGLQVRDAAELEQAVQRAEEGGR